MKMLDLRNIFLRKLDSKLSVIEKKQLTIHLDRILSMLAKDLDMPISGLFLLKDAQDLPNSVTIYIKKHFDV